MVSYATFGAPAPFDPACRWVTSPVLPPRALAAVRLLAATYALVTLVLTIVRDAVHGEGAGYLSYFTHLSYIGLCAYLFAAGVQTAAFARDPARGAYPLQRWPRPLQALHVLLFASVSTFPFIVTAVFWALLASPQTLGTTYLAWENISVHALNSALALLELTLSHAPPAPWALAPPVLVLIALYLGVAYITRATQGFYPYSFLDPEKHHAGVAAYIAGIAAGTLLVFALAHYFCALRARIAGKRGLGAPRAALAAGGGIMVGKSGEALEGWDDVHLGKMEEKVAV